MKSDHFIMEIHINFLLSRRFLSFLPVCVSVTSASSPLHFPTSLLSCHQFCILFCHSCCSSTHMSLFHITSMSFLIQLPSLMSFPFSLLSSYCNLFYSDIPSDLTSHYLQVLNKFLFNQTFFRFLQLFY